MGQIPRNVFLVYVIKLYMKYCTGTYNKRVVISLKFVLRCGVHSGGLA